MDSIRITLPLPCSINVAYKNTNRGRAKTQECIAWEKLAFFSLLGQERVKIEGDEWLLVEYHFYFPIYTKKGEKKIRDVFNLEKVLSDFLEKNIPGFKDHKIIEGTVKKIHSEKEGVVIIIREKK